MEYRINNESITFVDELNKDKVMAEITFPKGSDDVYCITHTYVDPSLGGHGIASKLVELAISQIYAQGGQVTATCSYAKKWIENKLTR